MSLLPGAAQAAGGSLTVNGDLAIWQMIRASGLIAYLLLSVSVFMGIAVSVRALDWFTRRAWVLEGHQTLSTLAFAFTAFHVFMLLFNSHVPFGLAEILVPFSANWRPIPSALGTLALYLVALLVVTSYVQPSMPRKLWRAIHYGGFAAWVLAAGHGLFAGSDTGSAWVQYMYLLTVLPVAILIVFRVLTAGGRKTSPEPSNTLSSAR